MNLSRHPHRRRSGSHVAAACALGLALVAGGASWPGQIGGTVSAQELKPCALLSDDELSAKTSVAPGVENSLPSFGYTTCRYAWGEGVNRFQLVVAVTEASRMFPNMTPDQIKQRVLESLRAGTYDAVIPDIGDAAVFKPESYAYAMAMAFVKGRILQVQLDGNDALDKKDQIIELLKSAAMKM